MTFLVQSSLVSQSVNQVGYEEAEQKKGWATIQSRGGMERKGGGKKQMRVAPAMFAPMTSH